MLDAPPRRGRDRRPNPNDKPRGQRPYQGGGTSSKIQTMDFALIQYFGFGAGAGDGGFAVPVQMPPDLELLLSHLKTDESTGWFVRRPYRMKEYVLGVLVFAALAEGYVLVSVNVAPLPKDGTRVFMWHHNIQSTRQALFFLLPILTQFLPEVQNTGPPSMSLAPALVHLERSIPCAHLLKYERKKREGVRVVCAIGKALVLLLLSGSNKASSMHYGTPQDICLIEDTRCPSVRFSSPSCKQIRAEKYRAVPLDFEGQDKRNRNGKAGRALKDALSFSEPPLVFDDVNALFPLDFYHMLLISAKINGKKHIKICSRIRIGCTCRYFVVITGHDLVFSEMNNEVHLDDGCDLVDEGSDTFFLDGSDLSFSVAKGRERHDRNQYSDPRALRAKGDTENWFSGSVKVLDSMTILHRTRTRTRQTHQQRTAVLPVPIFLAWLDVGPAFEANRSRYQGARRGAGAHLYGVTVDNTHEKQAKVTMDGDVKAVCKKESIGE
ncbi:hypothetical protein F4604DRAFT_1899956 [Suillus subluteus]|nr:hypothetical protein F4604DRAFT_1899956 [Suillus subluteus]